MKIQSRFTKIAVASGLIVATGAAVLGITGFASAQVEQRRNVVAVAQVTETTLPTNPAAGTTAVDPSTGATPTPPAMPSDVKGDRPSPLATVSLESPIVVLLFNLTFGKVFLIDGAFVM
jgi:hypothetical protein